MRAATAALFSHHGDQGPVEPVSRSLRGHTGFTLLEVLVVVAIIALLLAVLLPNLSAAREQARTVACGGQLRQIGIAGMIYVQESRGWLVGSPNTSGNGARPGFSAAPYTDNPDHFPALHIFDWASPLLSKMGIRPPNDPMQRYQAVVEGFFRCPSNRRPAGPVNFPALEKLIPAGALAPSYATSRYFLYVGAGGKTGDTRGTLWWWEDGVPATYVPKLDRIGKPQHKVFLADAHVVSQTKGQIANANWGFTSQGAWRWHEETPTTYRGIYLREQLWRHRGKINILAFDGHVQLQADPDYQNPDQRAGGDVGAAARRALWWFPSGTYTKVLPSWRKSTEPVIQVP